MRKVPGLLLIAIVLAATSGCQCCDALLQLEAWKNQHLFGCFCPCLYGCGQNPCPPTTACPPATACPPTTTCPPVYGQSMVAPLTSQPAIAPSYTVPSYNQSFAAPYTDCSGATVVGSPIVDCSGATIVSSPVWTDSACTTGNCGNTVVTPGATIVSPGATLTPTPIPSLPAESHYAPPATR